MEETVTFFRTWHHESLMMNIHQWQMSNSLNQDSHHQTFSNSVFANLNHLDSYLLNPHPERPNPSSQPRPAFPQFGMNVLSLAIQGYGRKIQLAQSDERDASFVSAIRREQTQLNEGFEAIQQIMQDHEGMTTAQAIQEYESQEGTSFTRTLRQINPHLVELIESEDGRLSAQAQLALVQRMMGSDEYHYLDQALDYALTELQNRSGGETTQVRGIQDALSDMIHDRSISSDHIMALISGFQEDRTIQAQIHTTRSSMGYYEVVDQTLRQFCSVEGGLIMIASTLVGLAVFRSAQVGMLTRLLGANARTIPFWARALGVGAGLIARYGAENGTRLGLQALYQQVVDPELGRTLTWDRVGSSLAQAAVSMPVGMGFDSLISGIVGSVARRSAVMGFMCSAAGEGFSDIFENLGCELAHVSEHDNREWGIKLVESMLGGFLFEGTMGIVHHGSARLFPGHADAIHAIRDVERGRSTARRVMGIEDLTLPSSPLAREGSSMVLKGDLEGVNLRGSIIHSLKLSAASALSWFATHAEVFELAPSMDTMLPLMIANASSVVGMGVVGGMSVILGGLPRTTAAPDNMLLFDQTTDAFGDHRSFRSDPFDPGKPIYSDAYAAKNLIQYYLDKTEPATAPHGLDKQGVNRPNPSSQPTRTVTDYLFWVMEQTWCNDSLSNDARRLLSRVGGERAVEEILLHWDEETTLDVYSDGYRALEPFGSQQVIDHLVRIGLSDDFESSDFAQRQVIQTLCRMTSLRAIDALMHLLSQNLQSQSNANPLIFGMKHLQNPRVTLGLLGQLAGQQPQPLIQQWIIDVLENRSRTPNNYFENSVDQIILGINNGTPITHAKLHSLSNQYGIDPIQPWRETNAAPDNGADAMLQTLERPCENSHFVPLTLEEQAAIRSIRYSSSKEQIHFITDPNRDPDDLAALIDASLLARSGLIDIGAVVTTNGSREIRRARARFAAEKLAHLGTPNNNVAIGADYDMPHGNDNNFNAFLPIDSLAIQENGVSVLANQLRRAKNQSQTLVIIAGQTDSAQLLREYSDLVRAKVRHIVIMGGIDPDSIGTSTVLPDTRAFNNIGNQSAAKTTYTLAQELGIPLTVLQKEAAYAAPASLESLTGPQATGHPMGRYLNHIQQRALSGLFENVIMGGLHSFLHLEWFYNTFIGNHDFSRFNEQGTPQERISRLSASIARFHEATLANPGQRAQATQQLLNTIHSIYGENPFGDSFTHYLNTDDFSHIWRSVSRLNQYDPLTLLAAIPAFRDALYHPRLVSQPGSSPVYFIGADEVIDGQQTSAMLSALSKLALRGAFMPHEKARTERPSSYPQRASVPDEIVSWERSAPGYHPNYHTAPVVLQNDRTQNPKGWADPEDISQIQLPTQSYEGTLIADKDGYPLNPRGRTGIRGRGLLGNWGPNYAADPIILRRDPLTHQPQMLAIQRRDTHQWAIPGGMVDPGEQITRTLARELQEETGADVPMSNAEIVYQGYVDDPRNTDNAWMETTARVLLLNDQQAEQLTLRAGDDARAVQWMDLNPENLGNLYASHSDFVARAMRWVGF